MGYRVGLQCIESKEIANDFVVSQVVPVLTPDGRFLSPEKIGSKWFFQGEEILLSLPECSVSEQIYSGLSVGGAFLTAFALMFCFKMVLKFINGLGVENGG